MKGCEEKLRGCKGRGGETDSAGLLPGPSPNSEGDFRTPRASRSTHLCKAGWICPPFPGTEETGRRRALGNSSDFQLSISETRIYSPELGFVISFRVIIGVFNHLYLM